MKEVIDDIRVFNEERDWAKFHTPENLAKSIAIEAGELLECYQWGDRGNAEKVSEELADVLIYCYMLADKLQLDPTEIIRRKIAQNRAKYPVEKAKGNSKKYTEYEG